MATRCNIGICRWSDGALERWSVERTDDRRSLGRRLPIVGKRIANRSRLRRRS